MTFEIVEGARNARVRAQISRTDINMRRGIRQGFFAVGSQLRMTARRQMLEKKTGVKYKRLRRRSSSAGETPASQSGDLRNSLGYQIAGADSMQFGAGGRDSGVSHARPLERGTSRMRPRLLLGNAVKENEAMNQVLFRDAIARAIS